MRSFEVLSLITPSTKTEHFLQRNMSVIFAGISFRFIIKVFSNIITI